MVEILVKGVVLDGRISGPADKYEKPPEGPTQYDVKDSYKTIDTFLNMKAQPVVHELIDHLPFIEEGFVSASRAASCYVFNNCLVLNGFRPSFNAVHHVVRVAGKADEEATIDETLSIIKYYAHWRYCKYWRDETPRSIEIAERLESVSDIAGYLPQIIET